MRRTSRLTILAARVVKAVRWGGAQSWVWSEIGAPAANGLAISALPAVQFYLFVKLSCAQNRRVSGPLAKTSAYGCDSD